MSWRESGMSEDWGKVEQALKAHSNPTALAALARLQARQEELEAALAECQEKLAKP